MLYITKDRQGQILIVVKERRSKYMLQGLLDRKWNGSDLESVRTDILVRRATDGETESQTELFFRVCT